MRAPKPARLSHQTKYSAGFGSAASRLRLVSEAGILTPTVNFGSISEASGRKQAERDGNASQLIYISYNILASYRQRTETAGNAYRYVDIVGVTGSIPVAPTIPFGDLARRLLLSPK